MKLYPNAAKLMSRNPTLMGIVAGYRFYESPTYGDEAPFLMITPEGKLKHTDCFELPEAQDIGYYDPGYGGII